MKPERWANAANKLFPYQVGFTAPPYDFDAAPSDFLRIAPESVGVHGRMLHLPGYEHQWTDEFLSHFSHSFLIRDPAKAATSICKHGPDFVLKEIAFVEQRQLFDHVVDQTGRVPAVIDSDDLLENPYGTTEAYCKAVGISFIPEALSWKPGNRQEVSWYDGGSWHENLRNSDGLKPQPRKYIDIAKAPGRVKEIYEIVLPHYEHIYQHRLVADEAIGRGLEIKEPTLDTN